MDPRPTLPTVTQAAAVPVIRDLLRHALAVLGPSDPYLLAVHEALTQEREP
jgi:hypothetical protein